MYAEKCDEVGRTARSPTNMPPFCIMLYRALCTCAVIPWEALVSEASTARIALGVNYRSSARFEIDTYLEVACGCACEIGAVLTCSMKGKSSACK